MRDIRVADFKCMSESEAECAIEVIDQYDFNDAERMRAVEEISERAKHAPFKAYDAAHGICSRIINNSRLHPAPTNGPKDNEDIT